MCSKIQVLILQGVSILLVRFFGGCETLIKQTKISVAPNSARGIGVLVNLTFLRVYLLSRITSRAPARRFRPFCNSEGRALMMYC